MSALTEPNRQKSCRRKGFRAQKSQPGIANLLRLSITPLNRNAALLSLVLEIAAWQPFLGSAMGIGIVKTQHAISVR